MTIYCYWHKPPVVVAGRVATFDGTFPVKYLALNNITSGAAQSTQAGQTVLLGSAPGKSDKGRTRIKATTGSATINVAWSQQGRHDGELDPAIGDYVTVLDERRIWARIPRIVGDTVYMDSDIAAGSNITQPPPKACAGPPEAGTIDPATGKLEVHLDGDFSFAWLQGSGSGITSINDGHFFWSIGPGQVMSGSTTSRSLTVRFPPGIYYVKLKVTDGLGIEHNAFKFIYARDPANDQCLPHQIVSHTATPKGQVMDIRFFGNLDPDVYRDGSMIIVWEETSGGVRSPIFTGWHLSERGSYLHSRTADLGESILHFVDVTGRLSELPGFSLELGYNSTFATTWNQTPFNNLLYYFWFVLYWQSTVMDIVDFIPQTQSLQFLHFVRLTSDAASLYDQVNTLANMINPDYYLTCTIYGQMLLVPDPCIMNLFDRPNFIPYLGTLDPSQWTEISVDARRAPRVAELWSGALVSADTYELDDAGKEIIPTVWSLAPGEVRGQGPDRMSNTNRLVDGQFSLNVSEGNRYARINSPWGDIHITMPWYNYNNAPIDPAKMGRVVVNFDTDQPAKPFPATAVNCLVKQMDFTYDYQRTELVRTVQLTLEVETDGPAAQTTERPVEVPV